MNSLFKFSFLGIFLFAISSLAQSLKTKDQLHDEPCGKVVLIKYSNDAVEVILRPTGAKANRGEVFKKSDFDLNLVSQVAMKALEIKDLLFCAQMNSKNKLEYYISRSNGSQE